MTAYPKSVRLRDGAEVRLRPLEPADVPLSHRFFLSLSDEDRRCLRMDVTDIENVRRRLEPADDSDPWRLAALAGGAIVAEASLHQPRYGWMRHTAELRCIVARPFQARGLGSALFAETYQEATRRHIEKLYALVPSDLPAAVRISERLGFRAELTLADHLRTPEGELKDLIVMTVNLRDLWRRLEDLMQSMDGHGRERP